MFVAKAKLKQLMKEKTADDKRPDGNYHKFAKMLNVDVAHLHRVVNNPKSVAGPEFLGKLMSFCIREKLDFNQYIFLDSSLHACNDKEVQPKELKKTA